MSPAPHAPGRSPPDPVPLRSRAPRPVILPPSPRTSRSFVLAATRLRALHLDLQRNSTDTRNYRGSSTNTSCQRPPSS